MKNFIKPFGQGLLLACVVLSITNWGIGDILSATFYMLTAMFIFMGMKLK